MKSYTQIMRGWSHLLRFLKSWLCLCWLVFPLLGFVNLASASDFLPTWQAFKVSVAPGDQHSLWVKFDIAPEYHIYQNKIIITTLADSSVELGQALWPDPQILKSPDLGTFQVYENKTNIQVPIKHYGSGKLHVQIRYQGCKGLDLCFPEQSVSELIDLNASPANQVASPMNQAKGLTSSVDSVAGANEQTKPTTLSALLAAGHDTNAISHFFAKHSGLVILGFFGLGLLIAFTPCVFPLLPVLMGVISANSITNRRSMVLACSYILGGASAYAVAGVIAASLGFSLSAALQASWLNLVLSLLFAGFALSLFDLFNLQLPISIQNQLNRLLSRRQHGSILGSFSIGALANLILSPCVTAPLAGALVYITTTGNQVLGGLALFALGLGSGIPLVIIAVCGKRYMPKSGPWMMAVKQFLGMLMLALAIYQLSKVANAQLINWLLGIWVCALVCLLVTKFTVKTQLRWAVGIICLITVVLIEFRQQPNTPLDFSYTPVSSIAGLDHELKLAKTQGQPVILDYYATWCIACKEMDLRTFSNQNIANLMQQFKVIRVDVSANDQSSKILQQRYQVIAPPSLVFLSKDGEELRNYKVTGFISSENLVQNLQQLMAGKIQANPDCGVVKC